MPLRRSSKELPAEEVRRLKRDAERIDREERDAIRQKGRAVKARHERLRDIVQVLKAERQRLGLSLAEVGERSGIGKANLSRLENDPHPNPTVDTLLRYAEALGRAIHIALSEPEPPNPGGSTASGPKRVFILGAGFSKPAGLPLATELLPLLINRLKLHEMSSWLDDLSRRLAWLAGNDNQAQSSAVNIEQVFHYAHFDAEAHRLRQHLSPVGRADGPDTPWNQAESVDAWLSYLEEALRDVIHDRGEESDLGPIRRWAQIVGEHDAVLTFNYDTLVERALAAERKAWNHGTGRDSDAGIPVFKLHGSVDWIVAHRSESFSALDLLFDKTNSNQSDGTTGHVEDDYRLWRCRTQEQLKKWIEGRDLQMVHQDACPREVGIAGLGAYKELHRVPGLGCVWARGMRSLYQADLAVVVGFSMSDFDAMGQLQFAEVARARAQEHRPLRVIVIDPCVNEATRDRFRRVFRTHSVEFVQEKHDVFAWRSMGEPARAAAG